MSSLQRGTAPITGSCDAAPSHDADERRATWRFPCSSYSDDARQLSRRQLHGQFLLDVTFGATDGSNTFAGVIVGYVLEVSPAPGAATFNDVPTTDFAFQYIEALVASGITGGCGGAPSTVPTTP